MHEERIRFAKTAVLLSPYFASGILMVVVGLSLLDLKHQINEQLAVVSLIFPSKSLGGIFGSFAVGIVYPRTNFHLSSGLGLTACAVCTTLVALVSNLCSLILVFVASGFCLSFLEASGYAYAVELWGTKSAVVLNAQMLVYGAGAFIAPFMAQPFITDTDSLTSLVVDDDMENISSHIKYLFAIVSGVMTCFAVCHFFLWFVCPETPVHETVVLTRTHTRHDGLRNGGCTRVIAVVVTLIMVFCYYGLEIAFGSFLVTFAMESDLQLDKESCAHLLTLSAAVITFPKVAFIFPSKFLDTEKTILSSLFLLLLGSVILVPFGNQSITYLWAGVAIVGLGMSLVWGCLLAYVDQVIGLSSRISSCMTIASSVGDLVYPFLISSLIEGEARVFLWTVAFCSVSSFILFAGLMGLKRRVNRNVCQS